jgi:magnesium and cobalt transporter
MNKKPKSGSFIGRWIGKLASRFTTTEPETQDQLVQILKQAQSQHLMDAEALSMMEGVLQVSELRVRDVMIPRARMVVVEHDAPLEDVLPLVVESAHSRFPVIDDDKAEVVGILLAKDLLQYCRDHRRRFNMRDVVRSAVFVPESKRLNVLLKEFRLSRNHMAIVVDEYGSAAGFVTIEDVLEQIVGEIEDEYDFDEGAYILQRSANEYTVKAHTSIEDFNEFFGTDFEDDAFDTVAGLMINALGHLPKRDETVDISSYRFRVVRADSRRIRLLNIERLTKSENAESVDAANS